VTFYASEVRRIRAPVIIIVFFCRFSFFVVSHDRFSPVLIQAPVALIHKAFGALLSLFDFKYQAIPNNLFRGKICILWMAAIPAYSLLCTFRSAPNRTDRLLPLLPCFFLRCQP
jgi:hypothetical protein